MKPINHTSSSGKNYEIEGDMQSGYRAKDLNNNERSVYCADSFTEMKNLIEKVERGERQDAGNFGKK